MSCKAFIVGIFFLWCCFQTRLVVGQHEADNWTFGKGSGLTFSPSGEVNALASQLQQIEGSATISDAKTGQLLFYTDGRNVWNRENQLMPNGQLLVGGGYATQPALIVPQPASSSRYYVFTTRAYNEQGDDGTLGGLYYSQIDLSLGQGLGDVVIGAKNQLLEQQSTEKLTAVPHANKRDYWILAHAWDSNEFLVYLLTPDGLSAARRIAIGTIHRAGSPSLSEAKGYLKASPNGKYLAAAVYGITRPFELYDFDDRTGIISNYRSLGNYSGQYGVSFSPDNTKLYLSGIFQLGLQADTRSYQFDLTSPSYAPTEITVTDTTRSGQVPYYIHGALQLGIDGKLYAATAEAGRLIVINQPNQAGIACDAQYKYFDFKSGMPLLGLPNFIQRVFNQDTTIIGPDQACSSSLVVFPNPIVNNTLFIKLDNADCPLTALSIYTVRGQLIAQYSSLQTHVLSLNVNSWSAGMYILEFSFGNQRLVKKIIKQ